MTAAGSTSFTVWSPRGSQAYYEDADPSTSYLFTRGNTNSDPPVPDSNYVRFHHLSGDVTINADASQATFPSNTLSGGTFINGLQVVPEPRVASMLVVAAPLVAWLGARRRSRSA